MRATNSQQSDAAGNITSRALDNGTSTAYTVDQMNRETAVVHSLVGGTKRFDYAYNNMSDIAAVQRDSSLGDGYTYDLNQEVLGYAQNGTVNLGDGTVTNPQTNTTLTFDGCGNRTSKNSGGTYVNDSLNCPTTFDGATLTYSPNGNLATNSGWTFTYDAQNRLTNAFLPGSKGGPSTNLDFYCDAKNRQIARNVNGAITFSVWDDWELVEEYSPGNIITAKFLQGAHGPVKSLLNAVYYYQDSLGSTSHIASSTGSLLEYYKYDLYGKPKYYDSLNNQLSTTNYSVRDLFSGERWIPEMSIYDLRNRFYSPDLGRFLQPDPIGFKGDASNLYRYCGNDWANRTDPMGLEDIQREKASLQNNDPVQKEFDQAVKDFTAHSNEVQQHYNGTPQLKGLNLQNNIQNMIKVVKNPKELKSFHDPKFIQQLMTRLIKAYMTRHIAVGTLHQFAKRDATGPLGSDHVSWILVNPKATHIRADSLPIDLAHEAAHLVQGPCGKGEAGDRCEYQAMQMGHDMGSACRISQRPMPKWEDIHSEWGN